MQYIMILVLFHINFNLCFNNSIYGYSTEKGRMGISMDLDFNFHLDQDIHLEYPGEKLVSLIQQAIQTRSYSDEEGAFAHFFKSAMDGLGFDETIIDSAGNVIGRLGDGKTIIQFDGHMDTVRVNDEKDWKYPPFSGASADGFIWGRGSVDMKSALLAAAYGAAAAKRNGWLRDKTVYVTGTVCEEYCDGVNLRHLYRELNLKPDCCIICEPSDNRIVLGHKGKAQIRIVTHGISSHGSAPEKGKNAVYEMAEIITRVEQLNENLCSRQHPHGTIVLSDISCVSPSLNAVPGECSIYLDRRLALGESLDQVRSEMEALVRGKDAHWETGTLRHTSWTGLALDYEPMHEPWTADENSPLAQALRRAWKKVYPGMEEIYDFWDFGTNAVTPVSMGIPTIGFGPGEYKLAHMRDERCSIPKIMEACRVYAELVKEFPC